MALCRCCQVARNSLCKDLLTKDLPRKFSVRNLRVSVRNRSDVSSDQKVYSGTMQAPPKPIAHQRKLFTPGPLAVSDRVKEAMLVDLGKRHGDFAYVVKFVRNSLLQIAKVTEDKYTAIPLDGSGTFATEAILTTILGHNYKKKILVMENGMYAKRIADMCRFCEIDVKIIPMDVKKLQDTLLSSNDVSAVMAVHCETSTGKINPVDEIGRVVKKCAPDCLYFVDGMTSFGAVPLEMSNVDFMISNSCKSLQGVPGVSFVIAKKDMLQKHRVKSNSLVMDVGAQFDELESTGQFRYTPPTHVMVAFKEALMEYSDEGGIERRSARYRENCALLKKGMVDMGFRQLFEDSENPFGYIVISYYYPSNPLFIFDEFYSRLSDAGHVISTSRTNAPNTFRIACIGNLYPEDIRELLVGIRQVLNDMRIELPLEEAASS